MADESKVMGGVMVIIGIIVVLCIILCTFYLYGISTDVEYIADEFQVSRRRKRVKGLGHMVTSLPNLL